jgi:tetratricopeptide (TPR) repeat protein
MTHVVVVLLALLLRPQGVCETGKALFDARSYAAAQEPLWACVAEGTDDREVAHRLALTYRELKNYQEGLARSARIPASIDRQYLQAYLLFRGGKPRDSLRLLEDAYRRDQADWRIHHLFGLNYVVLNIKEGAEASLENAIRLKPDNAELYYHLARVYYNDNRPRESITVSGHALALVPEYPEVFDNLGLCYEALAENDKAVENYRSAIELNRKLRRQDEWPLVNYAAFLIKQGQPEASLPLVAEAVRINEWSAKAHYLSGRALSKLGRYSEAKSSLRRAIELDAAEPAAYFELGMVLQREGDRAGARQNLARFESLRKGDGK